ncbi:sugar ABC transporter permease [Brevibacillus sp. NRS-1366]|uniref:sugar ABC transporter permease n=1 Tax=Brevibacillus sp. NRS-1366 TaxID=3233899 RepID=UPI003D1F33E5
MQSKAYIQNIPENKGISINWKNYTSSAGLVLLVIISALLSPTFLLPANIMNIATQIAAPGILAVGMTYVILTAGIDLSVGSLLALTGVFIAITAPTIGWPLAVLLAIGIGILIGCFHGYLITKVKLAPFIVTLASLTAFRGISLVSTNSAAIPISSDSFSYLGSGKINTTISLSLVIIIAVFVLVNTIMTSKSMENTEKIKKVMTALFSIFGLTIFGYLIYKVKGIPIQVLFFIGIFIIGWFILNKTVFGREVYAMGGNFEAARLAGVRVNRGIMLVYAIAGFLSAVAGTLVAARLGSGTPQVGVLSELDAIAAVVIGGSSLMGGVGRLGGTLIGVILIGVLNNLLSLLNITSDMQMVFKGAIILGAVILDGKFSKK